MGTQQPTRFPIRFSRAGRAMAIVGLRPRSSYVEISDTDVTVRMGWAFQAGIPLTAIQSVTDDQDRVLGWGVHGWRGRWLVNGSSAGIVRITIDPPARSRAVFVPIQLRVLRVSVDDPSGLIAALNT